MSEAEAKGNLPQPTFYYVIDDKGFMKATFRTDFHGPNAEALAQEYAEKIGAKVHLK